MLLLANLKKLDDSEFLVCLFCPDVSYKPQLQVEGDCSHQACPWPGHHGPVARTQNEGLRVAFSPNLVAFLDSFVAFLDTAKLFWSEKSDWWPVSPVWKSCNQFSLCICWVYIWCCWWKMQMWRKGKKEAMRELKIANGRVEGQNCGKSAKLAAEVVQVFGIWGRLICNTFIIFSFEL